MHERFAKLREKTVLQSVFSIKKLRFAAEFLFIIFICVIASLACSTSKPQAYIFLIGLSCLRLQGEKT